MILTDKFVYIHFPKTGGTFVTKVLKQLYGDRGYQRNLFKQIGRKWGRTGGGIIDTTLEGTQHGSCLMIPSAFRHKLILSTIRNPYDMYVSIYHYGYWSSEPHNYFYDVNLVINRYPHFPKISFPEFLDLANSLTFSYRIPTPLLTEDRLLGERSRRFIRLFGKKPPKEILETITEDYIQNREYQQDLFNVHFLRQENLNQDLYDFLIKIGQSPEECQFILDRNPVLPGLPQKGTIRTERKWEKYYTPELKQFVRTRDRLLFDLFPEYDL